MRVLKASKREGLPPILDYVHDRNYDLSKLEHNARERTLTIPVELRSNKKSQRRSWFHFGGREATTLGRLIIRNALGYKVTDIARIGQGDINTIAFLENRIAIEGNIPVEVVVDVEGLEIELVLPDDAKLA